MCPENTELRLIGCPTESIYNHKSKSNMLTPKTNSLICLPKRVSRMMSGIFFVSSTLWTSRCSLADISAIFFLIRSGSRVPCPREDKKRLPVKVYRWQNRSQWIRRWRSRDPWVWCCRSLWVRGRNLRKIWAIQSIGWMSKKNKTVLLASRNWCGTQAKIQSNIHKLSDRKILKMQTPGNKKTGMNLRARLAPGNWEVNTRKSFITCGSQIINAWQRFSKHLQKKLRITTGHSTFAIESIRTNVSIWGLFMSSSMKAAINLVCKNTNFEEIQVLFNMTQKIIWEHSGAVLNVHTIVKVLIPHGRDRHCLPLKQLLCDLRLTAKFESL